MKHIQTPQSKIYYRESNSPTIMTSFLSTAASVLLLVLASSSKCYSFQLPPPLSSPSLSSSFSSVLSSTPTNRRSYSDSVRSVNTVLFSTESGANKVTSILDRIEDAKEDLVRVCTAGAKPSLENVRSKVQQLEELAEQGGIGQASAHSGLLSGEWYEYFSRCYLTLVHFSIRVNQIKSAMKLNIEY